MKRMLLRFLPSTLLAALLTASLADAAVIPVSEDSYSFGANTMDKASGKSASLVVSQNGMAFMRFDARDFAAQIPAGDVTAARITFHIKEKLGTGGLNIHRVTSEWSESPSGARLAPSIKKEPLANLPASSIRARQFAVVDVTELVKQWLTDSASDFGIAIAGVNKASVLIASKEGPDFGHPATLEIEYQAAVDNAHIKAGMDAVKLGDGSVDNAEFGYLNGLKSSAQGQLDTFGTSLGTLRTDLTSLTTSSEAKVNRSGDTMTGLLVLPENGLKVGANQLAVAGGKVGIGTDTPSAALEVRGDVKLGATGELKATGAEENLRIVRGTVLFKDGAVSLVSGTGFTFSKSGTNDIDITFTSPFSSKPTITCEVEVPPSPDNGTQILALRNVSTAGATLIHGSFVEGNSVHFIAIGPR